ncbi:MAG: PTS sugar transporter subunit IIA [Elusimicrobiota bacterium]
MINIIVVTHGEFGAYLIEAAEGIVGPQEEGVVSIGISPRLSLKEVGGRLSEAVSALNTNDGLVIMTDMPGGTPFNVALPLVKDKADAHVLSGVNLYMLVTAFNCRRNGTAAELVKKVLSAGKRSISDIKTEFLERI